MKALCMALSLVRFILLLGSGLASTSAPVLVTLKAPDPDIKSGSEFRAEVTLTNNSDHVVTLEVTSPLRSLRRLRRAFTTARA